jgi:LPPG:FO 2-phospho-L-lactate transferase
VVSIGPILALPGVREALQQTSAPVVAISPIVGGAAIKGPAVPLMRAMHINVSAVGVADLYRDFLDALVLDQVDSHLQDEVEALGIRAIITDTIMRGIPEKAALARVALQAAQETSGEAQR